MGHRMSSPLVDTHFHLDLFPDPRGIVEHLRERRHYVVAVTNAPSVFSATLQLVGNSPRIRAALGLHPELVASRAKERELMWSLLQQTRYIGEVGLDYVTTDPAERKLQREVFSEIVSRCSALGDKILTIHSRRAAKDVIEMLRGFRGSAILHWFTGSKKELTLALDAGLYLSVNPVMCRSEKARKLICEIPRDRLLTETDGPFAKTDNRASTPDDVITVVSVVAELWNCEVEEVKRCMLNNLRRITANHYS